MVGALAPSEAFEQTGAAWGSVADTLGRFALFIPCA